MTIEVIQFPSGILPSYQRLTPDAGNGQQLFESEFSGAQSVITWQGAERWMLEMGFADMIDKDRNRLMAFAARLRVSRNAFLCVNHTANNKGVLTGTPLVNVSTGQYLVIGNLGASVSSWAQEGDFVAVNSHLKIVLGDVGTSGGGVASLHVWPPFYSPANSGTNVVVNSPAGAFRLVRATVMHTEPPGYRTNLSITAIEHINSSYVAGVL